MGVSPMKGLRDKNPEIPGPADENVGHSRAGRPCHLRAIPAFTERGTSRHPLPQTTISPFAGQ